MAHRAPPRGLPRPAGRGPPRPARPQMFPPPQRTRAQQTQSAAIATAGSSQRQQSNHLVALLGTQQSSLPAERQRTRMEILEVLAEKLPPSQLQSILAKYDSDRIGVGGSTGDSDVGEQSQGPTPTRNPGESAAQIEQALFEKTGSNASGGQYSIMAKKVVEHLSKSQQVSIESESDATTLVSQITNQRRPGARSGDAPPTGGNPFGAFQVRRPGEGASMAQGGMGRQKPRPRFAASAFVSAMPSAAQASEPESQQPVRKPPSIPPRPPSSVDPVIKEGTVNMTESAEVSDKQEHQNPVGSAASLFGAGMDETAAENDSAAQAFGGIGIAQSPQNQQSAPEEVGAFQREKNEATHVSINNSASYPSQQEVQEQQPNLASQFDRDEADTMVEQSPQTLEQEPVDSGSANVLFGNETSLQTESQNEDGEEDVFNYFNQPAAQQRPMSPEPEQAKSQEQYKPLNSFFDNQQTHSSLIPEQVETVEEIATAQSYFNQTPSYEEPQPLQQEQNPYQSQGEQVQDQEDEQPLSNAQSLFGGSQPTRAEEPLEQRQPVNAYMQKSLDGLARMESLSPEHDNLQMAGAQPPQIASGLFGQQDVTQSQQLGESDEDGQISSYFAAPVEQQQEPIMQLHQQPSQAQSAVGAFREQQQFEAVEQNFVNLDSQPQLAQAEQEIGFANDLFAQDTNAFQSQADANEQEESQVYRGFQEEDKSQFEMITYSQHPKLNQDGTQWAEQQHSTQPNFKSLNDQTGSIEGESSLGDYFASRPQQKPQVQQEPVLQSFQADQRSEHSREEFIPVAASMFGGNEYGAAERTSQPSAQEKQTAAVFFAPQSSPPSQPKAIQEPSQESKQVAAAFFEDLSAQSAPQQHAPHAQTSDHASLLQTAQGSSASFFQDEQARDIGYASQRIETDVAQSQMTVPHVMQAPPKAMNSHARAQPQTESIQTVQVIQTEPSPRAHKPMVSDTLPPQENSFKQQLHKSTSSVNNQAIFQIDTQVAQQQHEMPQASQSMAISPRQPVERGHQTQVMPSPHHNNNMFVAPPQSERKNSDRAPAGFIQAIASSKPPQSVASINFSTMMEDSESLIRAYKKKKAELETLRDQFYQVETQLFTVSKKSVIMEEENQALKSRVADLERLLKESQMREIRRESADAMSQQLALKTKEVEMYQKEVHHQKAINGKLQEKMKELVMRKSSYANQSAAQTAAQRDKMQSSQPEIVHSDFNM